MSGQQTSTRDEVIALETSYWDAMKAKDGRRTAALSGENSLVTGARGVMSIARRKMGEMTEEGDWSLSAYEFDNVEVIVPAPNVAIIAYTVRQTVTMKGKPRQFRAADSSTWVRDGSEWHCHGHSETILSDNSEA